MRKATDGAGRRAADAVEADYSSTGIGLFDAHPAPLRTVHPLSRGADVSAASHFRRGWFGGRWRKHCLGYTSFVLSANPVCDVCPSVVVAQ